jgi:hypothetical protein
MLSTLAFSPSIPSITCERRAATSFSRCDCSGMCWELSGLRAAITERLASATEQEKLEVEGLSKRAIDPRCSFDRKHRKQLYQLALFPNSVSWHFKLLHRLIHDH